MARGSFVWTGKEVELLLNVVLEFKANRTHVNVDWESCQTKYVGRLILFTEQYPEETSKDFPHRRGELMRATLTTEIKAIRAKYPSESSPTSGLCVPV